MAASMEAISWTQDNGDKFIELLAERPSLFNIESILPGTGSGAGAASSMRGFLPLLNGLLDAANLLKYVQYVRRYFCA
jgi:hypothetical protein